MYLRPSISHVTNCLGDNVLHSSFHLNILLYDNVRSRLASATKTGTTISQTYTYTYLVADTNVETIYTSET